MPYEMHKWLVAGIDEETGYETTLTVEATSADIAKVIGERRGIRVASINIVTVTSGGKPNAQQVQKVKHSARPLLDPMLATAWISSLVWPAWEWQFNLKELVDAADDNVVAFWIIIIWFSIVGLDIASIILWARHLHRLWASLPRNSRRTTPARAVGFSFIPFFNFYWLFVAVHGLAIDMSTVSALHGIKTDHNALVGAAFWAMVFYILSSLWPALYSGFLVDRHMMLIIELILVIAWLICYSIFAEAATTVSEKLLRMSHSP